MPCSNVVISNQLTGQTGRREVEENHLNPRPCHGSLAAEGGQGCRPGWQLGSILRSWLRIGGTGGSHKRELEWVVLPEQWALRWSLQNVETTRCVSHSCWRCQLNLEVHTHTYELMTGRAEVLKGVTALSGSVPPCPLLPTSFPLRHSEGMAHHTRLTPEILSYRYSVYYVTACVWWRACVSSYEWESYWYEASVMCVHLCVSVTSSLSVRCRYMCDGVIDIVHLDSNRPSIPRNTTAACKSDKTGMLQKHDW